MKIASVVSIFQVAHDSIYIAGRYNKLTRNLPQTPWLVDGERKAESSVEEELVRPLNKLFKFDTVKFSRYRS